MVKEGILYILTKNIPHSSLPSSSVFLHPSEVICPITYMFVFLTGICRASRACGPSNRSS